VFFKEMVDSITTMKSKEKQWKHFSAVAGCRSQRSRSRSHHAEVAGRKVTAKFRFQRDQHIPVHRAHHTRRRRRSVLPVGNHEHSVTDTGGHISSDLTLNQANESVRQVSFDKYLLTGINPRSLATVRVLRTAQFCKSLLRVSEIDPKSDIWVETSRAVLLISVE
jgi:hypothetical protein